MNVVAIIVSCAAMMGLGMFWYSGSGFGKAWMESIGIKWPTTKKEMDAMKKKGAESMPRGMIGSIIGNAVTAVVMALLMARLGVIGLLPGLVFGFVAWLGFVAGRGTLSAVLWEGKPWNWYFITAGHELVGLLIMGAILGVWQ